MLQVCLPRCCVCFTHMLQVFYLDVVCVSHICYNSMFQIFHLCQTYIASKVFYIASFHRGTVSEGAQPGHRGMWRDELGAGGQGAASWGPAPGSRPGGERGGGQGKGAVGAATGAGCACKVGARRTVAGCAAVRTRRVADAASRVRVRVRVGARQTEVGYADIWTRTSVRTSGR